ncbi:TPA: phage tail protein [Burkholderia cenocepacia]|nr:phage tail protein [Burkholderia cenocepacia]
MNVSSASALATFTADEIVVETTLGGGFFRLAGFNKTINLATTGAGGMDTGSAPTSGFVALYAIYNPTTQTSALLATNAASALAPSVYGGGSMPSGYTASALLTVVPTNSSSQFAPVFVQDRKVNILQYTALSSSSSSGFTNTALSIAGGVPRNAKRVGGSLSLSNSTAANSVWVFYATSSGAGPQQYSINTTGSGGNLFGFSGLDLSAAQTMQYALLSISAGTCSYIVYISSYEI